MTSHATLKRFACSGSELVRYSRKPEHSAPEFCYLVRIFREHSAVILRDDIRLAAIAFRGLTGMLPDHINGVPVLGYCEGCGRPFLDDREEYNEGFTSKYVCDSEGVYVCNGPCKGED
jgi:hypothetical protein